MFYSEIKLGLENMSKICNALDDPQNKIKIIHIAGTNGKGSVGRLIADNLIYQGYRVGHFSSPSVTCYYDIWQINNKKISKEKYDELYSIINSVGCDITQFETETLIAFMWFNEQNCDYAIIETGMGGRLDATNIVNDKLLCVITPIDIDHTKFLGNSIYEIAKEKGGIIKNNFAVSSVQHPDAEKALQECSDKIKFVSAAENIRYYDDHTLFDYKNYKNIEIKLLGKYQADNAVLAIEALESIGKFNINGFENTVWHCRFEKINNFILDGAHNIHGIKALEENINIYLKDKNLTFITGIFADKDYKNSAYISKYAKKIYTVESSNPRCLSAEKWADEIRKYNDNVVAVGNIQKAVELAKNDEAVLVFGSLSIMSEVYNLVQQNFKK